MKKELRIVWFIFVVLILPVANAEDFKVYSSLVISNKVSGSLNVLETGSNPSLEYLTADLSLFPRKSFQQTIINQLILTDPEYESLSIDDDSIIFKWDGVSNDKLNFEVNTELEISNTFPKISQTINFPISDWYLNLKEYISETDKIDINSDIRIKANELASGETDMFIVAYKIGDWVKKNIKYDLNTLTAEADQKASWVFNNKKGVCDEITNLFIAMLRSLNIPSRFVSGIVYSNLNDEFGNHGWAEVYFPGYGWVPFDITFGQYGWIDPSHIKMDDSSDSGVPSVEYHWKSRHIDIKAEPLEFQTEVKEKKDYVISNVALEIRPLKEEAGFESYVPIEVIVKNLNDYYLPLMVFITKAPELVEKDNSKSFVLKPQGKKRLYWTVKIPGNLKSEYLYSSELEAKTAFGDTASSIIKYANNFEKYSKAWAEDTIERLSERDKKFFFSSIDLKCYTDKEFYYPLENSSIRCEAINTGNTQLDNVNVCLGEECNTINLGINEKKNVNFIKALTKSETILISAENKDSVIYEEIKLNVVEIPDIQVIDIKPNSINYHDLGMLSLELSTDSPAYNVKIEIKGLGTTEWKELPDKNSLKLPFEGKIFSKGYIQIRTSYDDALNKTYVKEEKFPILITDLPAHIKIWNWFKSWF